MYFPSPKYTFGCRTSLGLGFDLGGLGLDNILLIPELPVLVSEVSICIYFLKVLETKYLHVHSYINSDGGK